MDKAELGELAVVRYERSRKMSRDTAAANDLPVVWFWQPSRLSRPPVDGEPTVEGEGDLRRFYGGAESNVPSGVVDLTAVFDDVDAPLFTDEVHHNEVGARLVAVGDVVGDCTGGSASGVGRSGVGLMRLIRYVARLVFETIRFGFATRHLMLIVVVCVGLLLVLLSLTAQVVAPLAVYPFA